ncbi:MAG: RidA family protein [Candidatus Melainabacteria bacterium]|nr:RidA family protein [Candidatus Melainabacteria bacterium]
MRKSYNIVEGKAPRPLGAYSHAIEAGGFLFVSGQGARDATTGLERGVELGADGQIASYDIRVQTEAVIDNLTTVLKEAGLSLTDLVDVTVFLADMNDFKSYNEVYEKHFSFPDPPARTTVQAARLPGKNFIEIKATAYRRA